MNGADDDDRQESLAGIDPQTAAYELRTLLAASGEGQGIVAQRRALACWAEKHDRSVGDRFDISEARLGGLEHYVWEDEAAQVVRKFTYGGSFGRTVRSLDRGLVPATPLEYLTRWANHNWLFPPITRVSGVLESPRSDLSLLIEQDALLGDLPSLTNVQEFMLQSGFVELSGQPFAWINRTTGFAAFDARPANFVEIVGSPVPFDLVIVPLKDLHGVR